MNEAVLQRGYNANIAMNESLKRHGTQSRSFSVVLILWRSSKPEIYMVYQTTVLYVSSAIRMKYCFELPHHILYILWTNIIYQHQLTVISQCNCVITDLYLVGQSFY